MVFGLNTCQSCWLGRKHPDSSGHQEQVYSESPGSEPSRVKLHLAAMVLTCGTNSLSTWGVQEISVRWNQGWKQSCLLHLSYRILSSAERGAKDVYFCKAPGGRAPWEQRDPSPHGPPPVRGTKPVQGELGGGQRLILSCRSWLKGRGAPPLCWGRAWADAWGSQGYDWTHCPTTWLCRSWGRGWTLENVYC